MQKQTAFRANALNLTANFSSGNSAYLLLGLLLRSHGRIENWPLRICHLSSKDGDQTHHLCDSGGELPQTIRKLLRRHYYSLNS
jgi:hypothetical protein